MDKILIIEDDLGIAEIERDYLEIDGFAVTIITDGTKGLQEALTGDYDLILLDLMLPGTDGFQICRQVRKALDIPILMVTARTEDIDKIRGLGMGADDYIEKPFSPGVLVARVKANLAQYRRVSGRDRPQERLLTLGPITLDTDLRTVTVEGREVDLKNKLYELLLFFMNHPNQVFSREELYERIWGMSALRDCATVAVHINRLREAIEENPAKPRYIQTVWGVGYRFRI